MKKLASLLMALLLVFATVPAAAFAGGASPSVINDDVQLDEDPSGGYTGDYVIIYNPSTSSDSSLSTGNMSGRIQTSVSSNLDLPKSDLDLDSELSYRIDVDGELAERAAADGITEMPDFSNMATVATTYNVGDRYTFHMYIGNYSPLGSEVEFEVLARGEHCYIWTPTDKGSNVYALDSINTSFANTAAAEFDSKYELMRSSFGEHGAGVGDGRVNLLFYNITDGWNGSGGYVGGFFTGADYVYSQLPMLHIDTYPSITSPNSTDLSKCYNTMVHEYQHLICFSKLGVSDTWFNESMSAAAEEICYPGSSIFPRIQSWMNFHYSSYNQLHNPPAEHAYTSSLQLHNGYSMYNWSNDLVMNDTLALYGQVSLFSQYVYSQHGNATFSALTDVLRAQGSQNSRNFAEAWSAVTGEDISEFVKHFRVALTANTYSRNLYNGMYRFDIQYGYNSSDYYNVNNLYNLLSPVVFTGSSCNIKGGGAITVKPTGGSYTPPNDASGDLKYIGISIPGERINPTGLTLEPSSLTLAPGESAFITATIRPANANSYTLNWSSSIPNLVSISGRGHTVKITAADYAPVSTNVLITVSSGYHSGLLLVTIGQSVTFNEAANVEGGTLDFNNAVGSYPWVVDTSENGRVSVKSSNQGVHNSQSEFSLTLDMNAGDELRFDWKISSETGYDKLQFYVNGTSLSNLSGTKDWEQYPYTAQQSGTYTFIWRYSKDSSSSSGSDTAWVDNVELIEYVPPFNEAANVEGGTLDFNNAVGNYPWVVDTSENGRVSVKSSNQGVHNSQSEFSLTLDMNAGDELRFDWKISSEAGYDKLQFYVNGTSLSNLSGTKAWEQYPYTAQQSGTYTFIWRYSKDSTSSSGSDTAWVDNVELIEYVPSFNEAANIEGGTLDFNNAVGNYPWVVDTSEAGRISVRSSNQGVNNSESKFSVTLDLNRGDELKFDWRVSSEESYDELQLLVNNNIVTSDRRISGARDWAQHSYLALADGTYTFTWCYKKDASGNYYDDTAWVDNIELVRDSVQLPDFNEAVNIEGGTLDFDNNVSTYPWMIDDDENGRVCVSSSNHTISNSESSFSITLNLSRGDVLRFDWKVDSEADNDKLHFLVNAAEQAAISGQQTWANYSYTAPQDGSYTFTWSYIKNASVNVSNDTAWVDNVELVEYVPPVPDINGDGSVDVNDALLVMRHAMAIITLSDAQLAIADLDGDGVVTVLDALLLVRMSLGVS